MKNFIKFALILMLATTGNAQVPDFNKTRAFDYLKKQCDFGSRNPGSKGHRECALFLQQALQKYTDQVRVQNFMYQLPGTAQTLTGSNIIATFQPWNPRRVLLCAHWDSRPWADMDPNPKNHRTPVLGANDGASGVAVLLEIAHHLEEKPTPYGIDIVFFDAEDAGTYQENDSWAIGSRAYANQLKASELPEFGILLDMIGDADLAIYQEVNSKMNAPGLVDYIWHIAEESGVTAFKPQLRYEVHDDHINLLQVGVPCVDIIDFDYPFWHTIEDVPEKCSPESLENVGRVILDVIYRGEY